MIKRDSSTNKLFINRILFVYGVIFFLIFIIVLRLFHIQIIKNELYLDRSDKNRIKISLIPSPRGIIYDKNNIALTENNYYYSIVLSLEDISTDKAKKTFKKLSNIINISKEKKKYIKKQIASNQKNVVIVKNISWDQLVNIEINRYNLPGIYIQQDLSRIYNFPFSTSHIVGYVSKPRKDKNKQKTIDPKLLNHPRFRMGATGLERSMDNILRGKYGIKYEEVDAYSAPVSYLEERSVTENKGNDIKTTIDINLQNLIIKLMKKYDYSGSAIVMEVNNGNILSIVSSPSFDSNKFVEGISSKYWNFLLNKKEKPLLNKAINAEYPPGSIFKLMSSLAILEKGVNPKKKIKCKGIHKEGNQTFHCWKKSGHGKVNFSEAVKQSCNVYFFKTISENNISVNDIVDIAKDFGYGSKDNFKIGTSNSGNLPSKKWKDKIFSQAWFGGDTMNTAIGQGFVLATPLQINLATAIIANGGKIISPKIIEDTSNSKNNHINIAPKNLKILRNAMKKVVNQEDGTAFNSKLKNVDFKMAGKTGTSQVISKREEEMTKEEIKNNKSHALFTAFFPIKSPKYAITIFIENGESGAKTAAPLAKEIIEKYQNW